MLRRALALAIPGGIIGHVSMANAQMGDHRQAIDALFRNFSEAYGRHDADAIGALFTEDAILMGPAPIVIGRQAIAQNYKGRFNQGFGNIGFQFQYYDPDGAWAAGTYTVSLPQAGGERLGNVTSIFRRQANALLIHVHTFNFRG
ncbi:YybH family protein [Neoroseomonas soli]|uniref:Nuclear transport factor 2 family protein n=1 Tax=Neoroseomonas soli TaxID=1081025 RepID=A0A9X9X360_9PROT|nr:nuclear transport factor 2 family protein [Neoroseomonas soli]MBR0673839.1 nuclear transport factor 2 family protein [Neoroseomonas soli]